MPSELVPVTFIMATYNRAYIMARGLMSLLHQSRLATQVIVVDDCSTDDTWESLKRFAAIYPQLRIIRRPTNSGGFHGLVLNYAVEQVETDWFMAHSDDDLKRYHCLKTLEPFLAEDRDVVYGDSELHNTTDSHRSQNWDVEQLKRCNFIDIGEAVCRKSIWERAGRFDPTLSGAVDWDFFLSVAEVDGKALHVPETITDYFFHDQMMTKGPKHQEALQQIRVKHGLL